MVADEIAQTAAAAASDFTVTTPLRVLCVEDSENDRELFFRIARETFATVEVRTLREAMARLGAQVFDAVILDLKLPNGSGVELYATIRGAAGDAAIVVLTGADDPEQGRELIERGADAIYFKDHVAQSQTALLSFTKAVETAVAHRRADLVEREAAEKLLHGSQRILREIAESKVGKGTGGGSRGGSG